MQKIHSANQQSSKTANRNVDRKQSRQWHNIASVLQTTRHKQEPEHIIGTKHSPSNLLCVSSLTLGVPSGFLLKNRCFDQLLRFILMNQSKNENEKRTIKIVLFLIMHVYLSSNVTYETSTYDNKNLYLLVRLVVFI